MENDKIGNYIAKCRKEKGITQQQLADILCISNKAVSKWETSQGLPDTSILATLAKALDTTVDSILNGGKLNQPNAEPSYENLNWEKTKQPNAEPSNIKYTNETAKFWVNKNLYRFKFLSVFSIFLSLIGDVAFLGVLAEGETITAFGIGLWFNLISVAVFFYYYNITKKEVELYNEGSVDKIQFMKLRNRFFKPNLYFWLVLPCLLLLFILAYIF